VPALYGGLHLLSKHQAEAAQLRRESGHLAAKASHGVRPGALCA